MTLIDKISVIIPTIGRQLHLKKCILGLLNQTILPDEIIIIDNCPKDNIKNMITSITKRVRVKVRYRYQKNIGSSYSRNLGIRLANNETLAFIDNDCVADEKWLYQVIKAVRKFPNAIVQGRSHNGLPENIYSCTEHYFSSQVFETSFYKRKNITFATRLDTKNFAMRKYLIKKHRIKFDNRYAPFSIYEDIDFGLRYILQGVDIVYCPKALIWHYGRTRMIDHMKREFEKGRALYIFNNKWRIGNKKRNLIRKIFGKNSIGKNTLTKEKEKIDNTRFKLKREILHDQNRYFIIYFYVLIWISQLVIKLGYFFQSKVKDTIPNHKK